MTETTPTYTATGLWTPANAITFTRIVASPVLFWLIVEADATNGTSWAAFALGWVFGISDLFDGRIARATGVSRSGAFLDPLADKVVVLGCAVSLVVVGRFHWLPVAILVIREVWISLMRISFVRQGISVPASQLAKWKTLLQGVALMAAVMPTLEDQDGAVTVLLWAAVAITLVTGWQYLRDGGAMATAAVPPDPRFS